MTCTCRRCVTTGIYCADGRRGVFARGASKCELCGIGSVYHSTMPPCPEVGATAIVRCRSEDGTEFYATLIAKHPIVNGTFSMMPPPCPEERKS